MASSSRVFSVVSLIVPDDVTDLLAILAKSLVALLTWSGVSIMSSDRRAWTADAGTEEVVTPPEAAASATRCLYEACGSSERTRPQSLQVVRRTILVDPLADTFK